MPSVRFGISATLLILGLMITLSACKSTPKPELRRYEIKGKVVSVDKSARQVILEHEEIPGFMKAMTMGFKLKEDWALEAMTPGDQVSAILVVDPEGGYLENPVIIKGSGSQPESSTSSVHNPQVGEKVPDFALVNQVGKDIRISEFAGKPLMLTFIYTRCPLPDYCIRMSNNFAETAKELKTRNPGLYQRVQLLSISIDPEYDKPAVLRKYAKNYADEVDSRLQHWTFASGTPEQVRKVADFFGLSYRPESGQITHSLRTAILDKEGKIAFFYRGNEWTPEDAVRDLQSLQ